MSELVIALLLLVPIFIVVAILNISNSKRRKKARHKILEYIAEVTRKTGITDHYHKQLIHQTVIIDEKSRKLLIIDHNKVAFSYEVYPLDAIKGIQVINHKHSLLPNTKDQKHEHITSRIGVELRLDNADDEKFLILYDYLEHNIYQMADFEREAHQLHDTFEKAINSKLNKLWK